jgi:hypothetical protein
MRGTIAPGRFGALPSLRRGSSCCAIFEEVTDPLHVVPTAGGAWVVRREADPAPLSRHASETEAERAAARHAAGDEEPRIFVHDRYHRVRQRFTRGA